MLDPLPLDNSRGEDVYPVVIIFSQAVAKVTELGVRLSLTKKLVEMYVLAMQYKPKPMITILNFK